MIFFQIVKDFYNRQQFRPGLLGPLVSPFYLARKALFEEISKLARYMDGKLLDVGCGSKPYDDIFVFATEYVGLEIDTYDNRTLKQADFFYDGNFFPFEDECYDGVICNQVLEHVFNPDLFLREIHRVLKPQGRLLITLPFVWDEHEQPWDYARYSSFGIKHILKKNGFTVVSHKTTNADVRAILQLINGYIYKSINTKWKVFDIILGVLLTAPINLAGIIFHKLFPSNPDLYLDHIILACKELD